LSGSPLTCTATNGLSFTGPSATVVNLGISGETLQTALANYTTEVRPYCIQATATVPVFLHLEEGINDIRVSGASAATIEGYLTSYWADAVADGCTVTAATLTSTQDLTDAGQATRLAVNVWIRKNIGLYSYLDDLNNLLPDSSDTTWYQNDGVHYTAPAALEIAGNVNGIWTGKSGFSTLQSINKNGLFLNAFVPSPNYSGVNCGSVNLGGNCFYIISSAGADQKLTAFGVDVGGFTLAFNDDAYTTGAVPLSVRRSGYHPTTWALLGTALSFTGLNPCFDIADSSGTADAFFGNYVNIGMFSVNRNPCTGVFKDGAKTAATIQLNSTTGGTTSNMQILTTSTANSAPSVTATFDNTGMNLPTGETYKVNAVAGVTKTCSTAITAMTVVGGIITSLTCP
jgi:hypothetical protein